MKTTMFKCVYLVLLLIVVILSACSESEKSKINPIESKKIGFYETYNADQVKEAIQNVIKAEQNAVGEEQSVFKNFNIVSSGAIVGTVSAADTAAVSRAFAQYGKQFLPANLRLAWTAYSEYDYGRNTDCYELFALHTQPAMTGERIINASYSQDFGKFCISLKFDLQGAKQFSMITAENTGRQLAIVFDGKVLCAPNVMARIDGGNVQISRNFTEEEARSFVDRLNGVTTK